MKERIAEYQIEKPSVREAHGKIKEADESQTYRGYKIVFHPGYSAWTNMKNYYKVYAPQGYLVGGKTTLEKAKEMIDNRIINKDDIVDESLNEADLRTYRVIIKRYDDDSEQQDVITAHSRGEVEDKLNSDEYIEYWDWDSSFEQVDEKLIQSSSDKAFKKNVATEIKAGKPQKQALAIAYDVKRKNESCNEAYISGDSDALKIIRADKEYGKNYHVKGYVPDFSKIPNGTVITLKGLNPWHRDVYATLEKNGEDDWTYTWFTSDGPQWNTKKDNYQAMREIDKIDYGAFESLKKTTKKSVKESEEYEAGDIVEVEDDYSPNKFGGPYKVVRKIDKEHSKGLYGNNVTGYELEYVRDKSPLKGNKIISNDYRMRRKKDRVSNEGLIDDAKVRRQFDELARNIWALRKNKDEFIYALSLISRPRYNEIRYQHERPSTLEDVKTIMRSAPYIEEYMERAAKELKKIYGRDFMTESIKKINENESDDDRPLRVCRQCLMSIESHEGKQRTKHIYIDDEDFYDDHDEYIKDSTCDWCEESGFDELWELD